MVLPVSVYTDCPVPTLLTDGRVQQAEGQSWEEVGCSDPAAREGVKCSVKALNFWSIATLFLTVLLKFTHVFSHTPIWYHLLILVFPISNKQSSDCGYKYFFLSLSSPHHSPLALPPTLLQVKHEQRTDEDALGQSRMKKQELTNREQQLREQR